MEDAARNFYIVSGLGLFFVWMTTDYRDETDVVADSIDTIDFGTRPYTDVKHPTAIDFPERRAS